jgi:hypothetical protein
MKLSAPFYILKQQAKAISRRDGVRLHVALDRIAVREGFRAWSHLASSGSRRETSRVAYEQFRPGDLILVGSRPGQGKTRLGVGLAVEAMRQGNHAAFFTLECTASQAEELFRELGKGGPFRDLLLVDTSEEMSSRHIARRLTDAPPRTLVVVDYLQLLDQRRDKPPLEVQLRELRELAISKQAMVVCLSQIRREFEEATGAFPGLEDVRLPNRADLSLFDRACFLHEGRMQLLPDGSSGEPGGARS